VRAICISSSLSDEASLPELIIFALEFVDRVGINDGAISERMMTANNTELSGEKTKGGRKKMSFSEGLESAVLPTHSPCGAREVDPPHVKLREVDARRI
jgi:hypothetical protein